MKNCAEYDILHTKAISTIILKERFLMVKTKNFISVLLVILTLFSLMLPAFAEESTTSDKTVSTFDFADAEKIALTAAKSKMILEGLANDVASDAYITKVSRNSDSGRYTVVVRAERRYKYTCEISTSVILGKTIGFIADSEFAEQNIVKAFFGQMFEKIGYYFTKKFG